MHFAFPKRDSPPRRRMISKVAEGSRNNTNEQSDFPFSNHPELSDLLQITIVQFYYDPTIEFDQLLEDALTARFWPHACAPWHRDIYHPRLDIHESTDDNLVTATFELPGLASEGVTIDVHQNHLTVSGKSSVPDSEEQKNYVVRERRSGKFSRTLQLPFGTKAEDVKAKMENGILTITFPKTSPEQQAKRIVIQ